MMSCPLAPVSDVVNIDQKGKAYGAPASKERRPPKRHETLEDPGALDQLDTSLRKVCTTGSGRSSPILIKQLRPEVLEQPQKEHYGVAFMANYQALCMERHPSGGTSIPASCAPSSYQPNVLDSFSCSRNASPMFGAQACAGMESDQNLDDFAKATLFGEAEEGEECFPWSDDDDFTLGTTTCVNSSSHQETPSQPYAVDCKSKGSPIQSKESARVQQRFSHAKAQQAR